MDPANFVNALFPGVSPSESARIIGNLLYSGAKHAATGLAAKGIRDKLDTKPKSKKTQYKRPSGVTVKRDGVVGRRVYVNKKKRKVRKPSLAKRVAKLEGGKPALTRHRFGELSPYKLDVGANQKRIFEIPMLVRTNIEASIDALPVPQLTGVTDSSAGAVNFSNASLNATAQNTSIVLKGVYLEFHLKNAMTSNMNLCYKFVTPNDADDESYLTDLREDWIDRGLSDVAVSTALGANTLRANIPKRMALTEAQLFYPVGATNATRKAFKNLTKMKKVTLGPGDSTKLIYTRKQHRYRPENHDQETFDYQPGEVYLIVTLMGDLAHGNADETDFNDVVGYGATSADAMRRIVWDVVRDDGMGLHTQEEANSGDYTNFLAPEHVDNMQSAVEKDEQ